MRFIISLMLCAGFLLPFLGHTQANKQLNTKFGKLSHAEEEMKFYEKDPEAPAVILFDKCKVSCVYNRSNGFVQQYERHVRIKIFKKEAYEFATVIFPFDEDMKVMELKAICINNESGQWKETKLKNENVFEEQLTQKVKLKKMVIPGVKEGCIIEYMYTIEDQDITSLPEWVFQNDIPTIWSEYEAEVPQFISFNKMYQGEIPFSVIEEKPEVRSLDVASTNSSSGPSHYSYEIAYLRMVQENVPVMKKERFMLSPKNYISRVRFQINAVYETEVTHSQGNFFVIRNKKPKEVHNTWNKQGKLLNEYLEESIFSTNESLNKESKTQVSGVSTDKGKVQAIYDYISKNYQASFPNYLSIPKDFNEVLSTRKGSCSVLNLMMIYMLRAVGVTASPVMISTQNNGVVHPAFPGLSSFNRIITYVELEDGTKLLADAGEKDYPLGLLPEEDINYDGMRITKDSVSWEPLTNKVANKVIMNFTFNFNEEDEWVGSSMFSLSGYEAVNFRKLWKNEGKDKINQYFIRSVLSEGSLDDIKLENPEAFHEPQLKGSLKLKTKTTLQVANDKIYFNPTLNMGITENPFKSDGREREIYLGIPLDENLTFSYKIPENYKVEELPKSAKIYFGEKAILFDYIVEYKDNTVRVNAKMSVKQPLIFKEEYKYLQTFYGEVAAKMQEQVVLTKIK